MRIPAAILILIASVLPAAPCRAEEPEIIRLGFHRERLALDIHADNIDEAVDQLLDQAGGNDKARGRIPLQVDGGFRPRRLDLKADDVSFLLALRAIAHHYDAAIELDRTGAGITLRGPKTEAEAFLTARRYQLSAAALRALGLKLTSGDAVDARLRELGVWLIVDEVDAERRVMAVRARQPQLRAFEMLVTAVDLTGLDISCLVHRKRGVDDQVAPLEPPDEDEAPAGPR